MNTIEIIEYLRDKADDNEDTVIMWKLNSRDYDAVRRYLNMDEIDESIFYTTAKLWYAPIDPTHKKTYAVGSKGVYEYD